VRNYRVSSFDVSPVDPTWMSADRKRSGNLRPRLFALRRIPRAALALKKYFRGAPVSKMSDNEDAAASLGHSEISSVQDAPGDPVPIASPSRDPGASPSPRRNCRYDAGKPAKDERKVAPAIGGEQARLRNVFDDNPPWSEFHNNSMKLEPEAGSLSSQARAASGNAEVLAGEAAADKVNWT
jgi:hypothetical protein